MLLTNPLFISPQHDELLPSHLGGAVRRLSFDSSSWSSSFDSTSAPARRHPSRTVTTSAAISSVARRSPPPVVAAPRPPASPLPRLHVASRSKSTPHVAPLHSVAYPGAPPPPSIVNPFAPASQSVARGPQQVVTRGVTAAAPGHFEFGRNLRTAQDSTFRHHYSARPGGHSSPLSNGAVPLSPWRIVNSPLSGVADSSYSSSPAASSASSPHESFRLAPPSPAQSSTGPPMVSASRSRERSKSRHRPTASGGRRRDCDSPVASAAPRREILPPGGHSSLTQPPRKLGLTQTTALKIVTSATAQPPAPASPATSSASHAAAVTSSRTRPSLASRQAKAKDVKPADDEVATGVTKVKPKTAVADVHNKTSRDKPREAAAATTKPASAAKAATSGKKAVSGVDRNAGTTAAKTSLGRKAAEGSKKALDAPATVTSITSDAWHRFTQHAERPFSGSANSASTPRSLCHSANMNEALPFSGTRYPSSRRPVVDKLSISAPHSNVRPHQLRDSFRVKPLHRYSGAFGDLDASAGMSALSTTAISSSWAVSGALVESYSSGYRKAAQPPDASYRRHYVPRLVDHLSNSLASSGARVLHAARQLSSEPFDRRLHAVPPPAREALQSRFLAPLHHAKYLHTTSTAWSPLRGESIPLNSQRMLLDGRMPSPNRQVVPNRASGLTPPPRGRTRALHDPQGRVVATEPRMIDRDCRQHQQELEGSNRPLEEVVRRQRRVRSASRRVARSPDRRSCRPRSSIIVRTISDSSTAGRSRRVVEVSRGDAFAHGWTWGQDTTRSRAEREAIERKEAEKAKRERTWWRIDDWECQRQKRMREKLGAPAARRLPLTEILKMPPAKLRKKVKEDGLCCLLEDEEIAVTERGGGKKSRGDGGRRKR